MTTSHLKTVLPCPVQTVWAIVRDVQRYPGWRSDVERVETPDARTFRKPGKSAIPRPSRHGGPSPIMREPSFSGRFSGTFRHTAPKAPAGKSGAGFCVC